MKNFLKVLLLGTVLTGISALAHADAGSATAAWVKGEGMTGGEKLLTAPARVAVNVGHGVVEGTKTVGGWVADGAKATSDGALALTDWLAYDVAGIKPTAEAAAGAVASSASGAASTAATAATTTATNAGTAVSTAATNTVPTAAITTATNAGTAASTAASAANQGASAATKTASQTISAYQRGVAEGKEMLERGVDSLTIYGETYNADYVKGIMETNPNVEVFYEDVQLGRLFGEGSTSYTYGDRFAQEMVGKGVYGSKLNASDGGAIVIDNSTTNVTYLNNGDVTEAPNAGGNSTKATTDTVELQKARQNALKKGSSGGAPVQNFSYQQGTIFKNNIANIVNNLSAEDQFVAQSASMIFSRLGSQLQVELTKSMLANTDRLTQIVATQSMDAIKFGLDQWASESVDGIADALMAQSGETVSEALTGMGFSAAAETVRAGAEISANEMTAAASAEVLSALMDEKAVTYNVAEYVLVIAEALKANETDDATKQVNVKAEEFQGSQGEQFESKLVDVEEKPMTATTVADAATSLVGLLKNSKVDLALASLDLKEDVVPGQAVALSTVSSQASSDKIAGTTTSKVLAMTTKEQREVKKRRSVLVGEWAAAAAQVGEGSNAISKAFYERVDDFVRSANAATGTLGGLSAMNDSDRFVLFEITRGAALSAVGLGLQGALNLSDLTEIAATAAADSTVVANETAATEN